MAALKCGYGTSWEDARLSTLGHVTGVHPRHPGGTTHPPCTVVFVLIIATHKDVAANVVASFGPNGARNNNTTAMRWATRMLETSVPTTNSGGRRWVVKRRDLETPHFRPWQRQWVVKALSRRSSRYESGTLDLQIAKPRITNPAGLDGSKSVGSRRR